MRIFYQFFEQEELLIQKFSGQFSFDIYSKHIGQLYRDNNLKKVSKVLLDFRGLEFTENLKNVKKEVDKVSNLRKGIQTEQIEKQKTIKVFFADQPIPTAIAKIFVSNFPNQHFHICSTMFSVQKHLEIRTDRFDIEKVIDNLKYEFISYPE